MLEPHACHLSTSTALCCIGVERLGQADIVFSDMTELGGRQ